MPGIASSAPAVLAGQHRVGHVGDPGRLGRGDAPQPRAAHRGGAVRHARGDAPRTDRPGDRAGSRHGPGDRAGTAAQRRRAAAARTSPRSSRNCGPTSPTEPAAGRLGPARIRAIPAEGNEPAVWLLGSTGYSAELAGLLGLPFAFAYHFSAANARPALALYRADLHAVRAAGRAVLPDQRVGAVREGRRDGAVAARLVAAVDAASSQPGVRPRCRARRRPPSTAYSAAEQTVIAEATGSDVVGDPTTVDRAARPARRRAPAPTSSW